MYASYDYGSDILVQVTCAVVALQSSTMLPRIEHFKLFELNAIKWIACVYMYPRFGLSPEKWKYSQREQVLYTRIVVMQCNSHHTGNNQMERDKKKWSLEQWSVPLGLKDFWNNYFASL